VQERRKIMQDTVASQGLLARIASVAMLTTMAGMLLVAALVPSAPLFAG